jgi:soluble lytic murein transglycosylase-like protein
MTRLLLLLAIYYASLAHGLDPQVVTAVCQVESSFRPTARCGQSVGLMAVNVPVWKDALKLDPARMTEIAYNLNAGTTILRHYLDKSKGDIWRALWLYNNGYKGKNNKYVPQVRKAYKLLYGRDYDR